MRSLVSRGPRLRSGVVFLALAAVLVVTDRAAGQDPPPKPPTPPVDTVPSRPDSLGVAADSLPAKPDSTAAADTLPPVEVVVPFPRGGEPRWSAGVWEWDRNAILASGAVTLTGLLDHIPGITPIRSGYFGAAEGAGAWGGAAGRIEILLDGFALDPLGAGSYDLSRLELVHLRHIRVERRLGGLRIELETAAPTEHAPYTMIEAATGDLDTQVFRGLFMAPRVLGGPLALGVDRIESAGLGGQEPANTFAAWLKYGLIQGKTGLEFELRNSSTERQSAGGPAQGGTRRDWVLRARTEPRPGLTAAAFFGMSSIEDEFTGTLVEEQNAQAGVRAALETGPGWATAAVRLRSNARLPQIEARMSGGARLPATLHVDGDVTLARWHDGTGTISYDVRSALGPFLGVRPFAELSGGERGTPFLLDSAGGPVITDRTAFRVGAEFARNGFRAGVARVVLDADSLPDFGLAFDGTGRLFPGGELQGWELTGRVPLFWEPLSVEGWYTRWTGAAPWIYVPAESWRAALVYHHLPLESGNLEILARLEGHYRGQMVVPGAEAGVTGSPALGPLLDFYLQIRVMDVRAFIRWENLINHRDYQYLPGRIVPGQRVFYGVKWQFSN